jgi:selenophosphate synthase
MALLDEIRAKVPAVVLATKDTQAIADAFNAGRTKVQKVPIADVQAYLQTNGIWWTIKAAAADAAHPAQSAAIAVIDVAGARYENIDTTLPLVGQMLGGLVATGVITQPHMDDLMSLGVVPDPVSEMDVRRACWADNGTWSA